MADATATSAVNGFSAALNRMPAELKKSLTYGQGREMTRHAEITQKAGTTIYFCDLHSPWQRGSNESIVSIYIYQRERISQGTLKSSWMR